MAKSPIKLDIKSFFRRIPGFTKLINNYESLKEEVASLRDEVAYLRGEVAHFSHQVLELEGEKTVFNQKVYYLESEKVAFSEQVSQLENEKIAFSKQVSQLENEKIAFSEQVSQLENEKAILHQQLAQREAEKITSRYQLVDGFIRYLMQREPDEGEISKWSKSSLSDHEIFVEFFTSNDYQNRLHIPQNNSLFGILTKAESIDSYLLYPGFDQAQLFVTLSSEPYQLSDFNNCLKFLRDNHWITPDKNTFLDVGANIGSMAIYAIASGDFTKAIGIEASSVNYQFMQWNIGVNNLNDKIQVLKYGLADFIGEQDIICSPYNCGDFRMSSDLDKNSENLYHEEQFNTERVNFTTLDHLSSQHDIVAEKIGWICIDCQGSEGLIFKGGQEFFKKANAPIYVEFWPYGINRLNCREEYFEFIVRYATETFRWVNNQIEPITLDFLKNFYELNLNTTQHLDILILPSKQTF